MYIRSLAVLGVVSVIATDCTAAHSKPVDEEVPANALALEVENRNWSDVVIYILHDGSRTRFAQITAAKSATLAIPGRLVSSSGTIQLLVHRIGGHDDAMGPAGGPEFATPRDDYLSPVVSIRTGYTVSLTLEDDLRRSTIGVW